MEYAALDGGVPPYKPATSKATTVGHEVIAQAAPQAVYLGDFPPDVEAALIKALQQFELAGVQPSVGLAQAVRTANRALNLRRLIVTERVRPS